MHLAIEPHRLGPVDVIAQRLDGERTAAVCCVLLIEMLPPVVTENEGRLVLRPELERLRDGEHRPPLAALHFDPVVLGLRLNRAERFCQNCLQRGVSHLALELWMRGIPALHELVVDPLERSSKRRPDRRSGLE